MSILYYILIAIFSIVLIIVALFYLVKGLLFLFSLFLRLLPTIIKTTICWGIIVLLCSILQFTDKIPTLPSIVYPVLYIVILGLIVIRRFSQYGCFSKPSIGGYSGGYSGDYKGYVLNKKSKVIHEKYSDSEETISSHHRKEISYSEAMELINNNEKYHFKK